MVGATVTGGTTVADSTGTGVFVALGVGATRLGVGCVSSTGGAIRIGGVVRSGEVRGGRLGVGLPVGLAVGFVAGSAFGGGTITCLGGSAPGQSGCSTRTAPLTAIPVAVSATAARL